MNSRICIAMKIGIDASRAFQDQRTGIEEYSYQVIKNLTGKLDGHQVVLYVTKSQISNFKSPNYISKLKNDNFIIPNNWKIRPINFPRFWTQVGLSLEMLFHPVDALFIPSHVVPMIHPKNTVVTVHGLEFEIFPRCYSFWARLYMRVSIRMSCRWAKKVIAVSENTKSDLMRLYKVSEGKIEVIYEGVNDKFQNSNNKYQTLSNDRQANSKIQIINIKQYLLFIGRLEKRKNIEGIIEAYKILKEKYSIPHKLVLAGKPGYGYKNLKSRILNLKNDVILTGYISEEEKRELLKNADIFLFPTFYEGFGLPILEAQGVGVPVVASDNSSIPEIVGAISATSASKHELPLSAVLCDPKSPQSIAEAIYKLISNPELRNDIIKKGHENIGRFSWENCSFQFSQILTKGNGK